MASQGIVSGIVSGNVIVIMAKKHYNVNRQFQDPEKWFLAGQEATEITHLSWRTVPGERMSF
jgi:hypothetical protein